MRVAIIRRAPKASFSMDVYADGLVRGLKTVRPNWEFIELIPRTGYPGVFSGKLSGIGKYYERYYRYPSSIKQCKVDVFHIIDHSDGHILHGLKHMKQPKIVTCHDLVNLVQPENIQDQARIPWISMMSWKFAIAGLAHADHIIAVSKHTAKDVNQLLHVASEAITVVPNAVEPYFKQLPENQVNTFRQKLGIKPQTFCLLNVGSSHPRKNIMAVLQTLQLLKSRNFPVVLLKAGADFSTEQKAFIDAQRLNADILYLGKPNSAALVEIYNVADVLLAPSLYEGFGMTLLEAMACGTPVVTSNVTSLPDVAGDTGILVSPTDVEALAKAVYSLAEQSDYRKLLIEKGLERVKAFTWEGTAEKVATLYESSMAT